MVTAVVEREEGCVIDREGLGLDVANEVEIVGDRAALSADHDEVGRGSAVACSESYPVGRSLNATTTPSGATTTGATPFGTGQVWTVAPVRGSSSSSVPSVPVVNTADPSGAAMAPVADHTT